jgi:hypothetical protein
MILRANSDNYVQDAVVFYFWYEMNFKSLPNASNDNIFKAMYQMEMIYHTVRPSKLVRNLFVIGRLELELELEFRTAPWPT